MRVFATASARASPPHTTTHHDDDHDDDDDDDDDEKGTMNKRADAAAHTKTPSQTNETLAEFAQALLLIIH